MVEVSTGYTQLRAAALFLTYHNLLYCTHTSVSIYTHRLHNEVETDTELYNQLVPWPLAFSKHTHQTLALTTIHINSQHYTIRLIFKTANTWQTSMK